MRSLTALIGLLVLLVLLGSTGAVQGDVCLKHIGCIRSTGAGIQVDGGTPAPSTSVQP
jgi:hypothetical protein